MNDRQNPKKNQVCLLLEGKRLCGPKEMEEVVKSEWFKNWSKAMPTIFAEKYLKRQGFKEVEEVEEEE